jgi:hypothetical protein
MFIHNLNGIKCPIGSADKLSQALFDIYNKEIVFNSSAIRKSVYDKFGNIAFKNKLSRIYNSL